MQLVYKIGNALEPEETSPYWILHGCNNVGGFGSGFVAAINNKYGTGDKSPASEYQKLFENGKTPALGDIQPVKIGGKNLIINLISQKGCGVQSFHKVELGIPFRYEAFYECLQRVKILADIYNEKYGAYPNLVSPLIGCGLALAKKDDVVSVIQDVFYTTKINYTIYELAPKVSKN